MMYFLIIVAAIAVYVIMTRNKFNELQQMIKNGVSDIGVQSEALDRTLDKLIDIARNGYQKEIEGIAQPPPAGCPAPVRCAAPWSRTPFAPCGGPEHPP